METHRLVLRDVPKDERPRERMLQHGAEALSHAELLAILLRTGTRDESAVHLAGRVLSIGGGLRGLADLGVQEMTRIRGIGQAKALQLQAGIELGRRMARSTREQRPVVRRPQDAADYVIERLRYLQKEHFVCLFLDTKNQIIGQETLSIGTLNAALVHPREVFRAAIQHGSASLICVHNHPSGDPTPSPEDIRMTARLVEAGELVGIDVLDHLIIGEHGFVSLKEQGSM
ncbi:DNA repair protein RadC [Paenibacillus sp. IB182496]|uniref:DNA repair protein RadC n=1 Tax=Paenibacillus sabuli TaxID=2772509 RepID=A0A927BQ08_9BACL|nr:DNA repair protein RadC [Paenibacillus sabuli]MBD2844618.1 DNA repair protein RadC [Paenibacillus sabuli]